MPQGDGASARQILSPGPETQIDDQQPFANAYYAEGYFNGFGSCIRRQRITQISFREEDAEAS